MKPSLNNNNRFSSFTFCVDQASYNTYSKANEVSDRILVVSPDASVGDDDVLQAADDGGGEGRVVAGAEDNGEHQDKAKHPETGTQISGHAILQTLKIYASMKLFFLHCEASPIILDKSSVMKKTMMAGGIIKRQL